MFVDMRGEGCAECGRPATAWVDLVMWPCGCPAGVGRHPSDSGGAVVVLPVPRRAPGARPVGARWAESA